MNLRNVYYILRLVVIASFLSGLSGGCCITFNSASNGTEYPVGSVISVNGEQISVEQFQYAGGTWTSDGKARIADRNNARGSGLDIGTGNTNLYFLFDYPLETISLKFGDLGGNSNIKVNNEFRNLESLPDISGAVLDGVTVTVNANQQGGNWYGELILNGKIDYFSIGGQELWIDDLCKSK